MAPVIIAVAQFLGESIARKYLEDNILVKFKESQIKREIINIVDRTLRETIGDFPSAEVIFNDLDIQSYLSDPIVQNEIGKIVQSENITQPISDVLYLLTGYPPHPNMRRNRRKTLGNCQVCGDYIWRRTMDYADFSHIC